MKLLEKLPRDLAKAYDSTDEIGSYAGYYRDYWPHYARHDFERATYKEMTKEEALDLIHKNPDEILNLRFLHDGKLVMFTSYNGGLSGVSPYDQVGTFEGHEWDMSPEEVISLSDKIYWTDDQNTLVSKEIEDRRKQSNDDWRRDTGDHDHEMVARKAIVKKLNDEDPYSYDDVTKGKISPRTWVEKATNRYKDVKHGTYFDGSLTPQQIDDINRYQDDYLAMKDSRKNYDNYLNLKSELVKDKRALKHWNTELNKYSVGGAETNKERADAETSIPKLKQRIAELQDQLDRLTKIVGDKKYVDPYMYNSTKNSRNEISKEYADTSKQLQDLHDRIQSRIKHESLRRNQKIDIMSVLHESFEDCD